MTKHVKRIGRLLKLMNNRMKYQSHQANNARLIIADGMQSRLEQET